MYSWLIRVYRNDKINRIRGSMGETDYPADLKAYMLNAVECKRYHK
ncbi:hypothetical protein Dfer_1314 [Dyadobacter fermentans DSM 18053]|uniref:Uncharacterized protein n=1 Tax=Dyadobacter fermentans (strain ATCC 700827 / DSM 18053 / CIP 107007 / KCTC 52180 / NS114) TaxID=471854 RepID=C6W682_DYAFD|nr:hypothetical protein Dfer_1314 [Dyadobacter fermentans DSM 18053]